jgi:hypothetical protein
VRRFAPETPDQLNRLISQLLAKDPDDRFPNVMVLGRHMEAMEKALSRPLQAKPQPGKTEAGDSQNAAASNEATAELRDQATRAQPLPYDTRSEPVATDIHEAATLAQPGDAGAFEREPAPPLRMEPVRSTFTTIDEETRRQLELAGDSRWVLWAQLAVLVSVLAALVWGGWRLTRPYTADELFAVINTTIDEQGDDDLRAVDDYLQQFAERFPHDPRNAELDPLRQQLEFQRFERQARLKARVADAEASSPIGSLYLDAVRRADSDPGVALGMLQALVALYDPTNATSKLDPAQSGAGELDADQRWLVLARQKIAELNRQFQFQAESQLPRLKERLAVAAAYAQSQPDEAIKLYEAIIRLYGHQPWAHQVVSEARGAIQELERRQAPEEP